MSVDATRLQDFCTYGLMLISGTFQVILAFVSLYDLLGWSAFVGVAIMVRLALLNHPDNRQLTHFRSSQCR